MEAPPPALPLDQLYNLLLQTWKKSYPLLSGTIVQEHASTFWRAHVNNKGPQWIIHEKISALRKGISNHRPKGQRQPTLNQLWYGNPTTEKGKGHQQQQLQAKQNYRKRKTIPAQSNNSTPPIVITIDEEDIEINLEQDKQPEPLVVLEVVVLEEGFKDGDTTTPMDSSCDEDEMINADQAGNQNCVQNNDVMVVSEEELIEAEVESYEIMGNTNNDNQYDDVSDDEEEEIANKYEKLNMSELESGRLIRIRSLTSLMEPY